MVLLFILWWVTVGLLIVVYACHVRPFHEDEMKKSDTVYLLWAVVWLWPLFLHLTIRVKTKED